MVWLVKRFWRPRFFRRFRFGRSTLAKHRICGRGGCGRMACLQSVTASSLYGVSGSYSCGIHFFQIWRHGVSIVSGQDQHRVYLAG